jgi:MarR family transcriptional regulator, organic hydroperoxide resistance regulator
MERPGKDIALETALDAGGNGVAPFDMRNSPMYLINVVARLLTTDFMRRIARAGIAPAQGFVLGELWREEPLSQVELSRRLEIGKASVGQTLLRLERDGLVRRRRIRDDRRVLMIELTEAGRNMRELLDGAAWEQLELMQRALGEPALKQLTRSVTRVADVLRDRTQS